MSGAKVEMSDLQIVEFMEKLIAPPTAINVESKILPSESYTGFCQEHSRSDIVWSAQQEILHQFYQVLFLTNEI